MSKNNTASQEVDPLAGMEQVPSNWVKFGKVGDFVKGTYLGFTEKEDQYHPGDMQKVYEFRTQTGKFHNIEKKVVADEATIVNEGEFWQIGGKTGIDAQMRNVKPGTIVGMRFDKEVPSKTAGFGDAKVIVVVTGGTDQNYPYDTTAPTE